MCLSFLSDEQPVVRFNVVVKRFEFFVDRIEFGGHILFVLDID